MQIEPFQRLGSPVGRNTYELTTTTVTDVHYIHKSCGKALGFLTGWSPPLVVLGPTHRYGSTTGVGASKM